MHDGGVHFSVNYEDEEQNEEVRVAVLPFASLLELDIILLNLIKKQMMNEGQNG
jgi:hypothetical protein